MWQQISQLPEWMGIDSGEYVFQIFVGIDIIGFAGGDEAHEDGGGFAAAFAADEEEIASSNTDRADSPFRDIIIRLEAQIQQIIF